MSEERTAAVAGVLSLSLLVGSLASAQTAPVPSASASPPPAASASAAVVAPPPAPPAPALPAFFQPETGTPVEFDSTSRLVSVYVAQGAIDDTTPRYPDPFVKIGRTPVTVKLARGSTR